MLENVQICLKHGKLVKVPYALDTCSKMRLVRGQIKQNVILCGALVAFFGFYMQITSATHTNEIQGIIVTLSILVKINMADVYVS